MQKTSRTPLILTALLAVLPCTGLMAQTPSVVLAQNTAQPESAAAQPSAVSAQFERSVNPEGNWYFSWGYSRQQYAPSDIHVSQPELGNDFTVHQAKASDFPSSIEDSIKSLFELNFTDPQQNLRIGKFMNPEKTFAIEFSLDHSKYNVDMGQTVDVSGTVNNQPAPGNITVNDQNFNYALHNGLNHLMINAVWLHHLAGPENKAGDLQLISRVGAGILLPHADNTIFGNPNEVGPKNDNVCCLNRNDWWQINGWTAGVEVGFRYRVYKSIFLELTSKIAYGELRRVPVYRGSADQKIWMSEQILSAGFLF